MSALDQAFIKAYRKDADRWLPSQPASSRRPMAPHPPGMPVGLDALHHQVPAPHLSFATPANMPAYASAVPTYLIHAHAPQSGAPGAYYMAAPHFVQRAPIAQPVMTGGAWPTMLPPSEIAPQQELVASAALAIATPLQPAFEVAHFHWPALIEKWLAHAGPSLVRCAAELARRNFQQRKLLFVAGAERGCGVSHVVLCLARLAASTGMRVALVDAHWQRPQLAELLSIESAVGWEQVLAGEQPLNEALVDSPSERITLLPLKNTSMLSVAPGAAARTIEALRRTYDLVLTDAGALDTDAAAMQLATVCAGCAIDDGLLVRDAGRASHQTLETLQRRLEQAGITRWDIADNFG